MFLKLLKKIKENGLLVLHMFSLWVSTFIKCSSQMIFKNTFHANQNYNEVPLMPVRMAAIQKSTNNKCWRMRRKGNRLTLLMGMQTSTATMEYSVEIP